MIHEDVHVMNLIDTEFYLNMAILSLIKYIGWSLEMLNLDLF